MKDFKQNTWLEYENKMEHSLETGNAGPLGLLTRETREFSWSTGKIKVWLFIFISTGKTM